MTVPTIMLGWIVLVVLAIVGGVWLHNEAGALVMTFGIVGLITWLMFVFQIVKGIYSSR